TEGCRRPATERQGRDRAADDSAVVYTAGVGDSDSLQDALTRAINSEQVRSGRYMGVIRVLAGGSFAIIGAALNLPSTNTTHLVMSAYTVYAVVLLLGTLKSERF